MGRTGPLVRGSDVDAEHAGEFGVVKSICTRRFPCEHRCLRRSTDEFEMIHPP